MKGRALILIFLFLIILISPVSGLDNQDGTGQFVRTGYDADDADVSSSGSVQSGSVAVDTFHINDVGAVAGISSIIFTMPLSQWVGGTDNSDWAAVNYKIGGVIVGTGTFGYNKGTSNVYAIAFFDENTDLTNSGTYSGTQFLTMSGTGIPTVRLKGMTDVQTGFQDYSAVDHTTGTLAYMGMDSTRVMAAYADGPVNYETQMKYSFENTYTYSQSFNSLDFTLDKSSSNKSMVVITNDGGKSIRNETSVNEIDVDIHEPDMENTTWTVGLTNIYGDYFSDTIYFRGQSSTGNIIFNQSFYTDPEDIEVEWDIEDYDNTSYLYEIQMLTSVTGAYEDSWAADGNWNISAFISSAAGAASFDFYSGGYDLPIWVQAELWAQDRTTGVWTRLDSTPGVVYHENVVPGQIWTDKSNYNVTELVEISYTTNVESNFIFVEEPHSSWVEYGVPVGTYSFFYELSTSAIGNTTIYLSENDVRVDTVTISVSSESGHVYVAWMKDFYYTGETASFYYNSSNTSAQITVYDGVDNVVYGPATTQLGYHNGRVNTANTEPGTFLVSMYHDGTYYNDTMTFESVNSWVRFDSSKYNIGDTINIEYYLADPAQKISMWDAHQGLIIRFTTQHGVLIPGSMQTVPFTLSENNEYSYDVPARLKSGDLSLGYWTVFIEDGNGVLGDLWDEAYVCNATDDESYGTDASNEMIDIFFSPEGLFMILTAALTMMGLVAANHPAGGGAGAVVGVGFGVYFNVLPEWMLILTVITLVVLAGVTIAVHFKGK